MNGDFKYYIDNLDFNNREKLEAFYSRILRLQQEIMLTGEIVSPTGILFQYTKEFSKSDKLIALITPKMTYLITLLEKNRKYAIYTGGDIHGIYRYLEMIGVTKTLAALCQRYHSFRPSSYINNYAATL